MSLKSKNCLVVGLGKSGLSAALLLKKIGANVFVTDQSKNRRVAANSNILKRSGICGVEIGGHSESVLKKCAVIVISPAVAADNPLVVKARNAGMPVISEVELGYLNCCAKIVAITGTNGKTTTASLSERLLRNAGNNVFLCGNIGKPFCDIALQAKKNDYVVLEVSSFQLAATKRFKPKVSLILNIDEDHLDFHSDFREYYMAKARIFKNQGPEDFCLLRKDDYQRYYRNLHIKPLITTVSQSHKAGIYLAGDHIMRGNITLCNISEINLDNIKAIENFMFLAGLSQILNIPDKVLFKTVLQFKGLSHRIEYIGDYGQVGYVDDSKATNVSATKQALKNISRPVILIAGGADKKTDFSVLNADFFSGVKLIILTGQAKHTLKKAIKGAKPLKVADSFKDAVLCAKQHADKGDVILLSPMCASFDEFSSYRQRGKFFQKIVREINA